MMLGLDFILYAVLLLYVHRKRDAFSLSGYQCSPQGSTLSLPNFDNCPLCFLIAHYESHPSVVALALDYKKNQTYTT